MVARMDGSGLKDIGFFALMWQLSAPTLKEKLLDWGKRRRGCRATEVTFYNVGQGTQYAEVIRYRTC